MVQASGESLVDAVLSGNTRAIARAITRIENEAEGTGDLIDRLYGYCGQAWRIGVTGPPGAGKSTLADGVIAHFRLAGRKVGVVAVDPSSPFSGGAFLGDRIRMDRWYNDDNVFIRSMAARGAPGGLSLHAESAADVLDAAGYDIILMETVGVGQAELDIAQAVDTVVVVLVPESGDAVQAMKAGLMEIAEVFCINKADHDGADSLVHSLKAMLHLREPSRGRWSPEVVKSVATSANGLDELIKALSRHRSFLDTSGCWAELRQGRARRKVQQIVEESWRKKFWTESRRAELDDAIRSLDQRPTAPYALARQILENHR